MSNSSIHRLLIRQIDALFEFTSEDEDALIAVSGEAEHQTIFSLSHSMNKYFHHCDTSGLNPLNSVMHCMYCYWVSHYAFVNGFTHLAEKAYYLNKVMNDVELFYEVSLPDIWICDHPLGTIMGRAKYNNYFSFSQGCTVGNNKGVYPIFEEHVTMMSNSKVIGNSHIGNNTIIAANTYIKDENIPPNSLVFGSSPSLIIKENKQKNILWI